MHLSFRGEQMKRRRVAASPTGWNASTITAPVPSGAATGPVVGKINGVSSTGVTFTVPPVLQSITVNPQNSSLALPLSEQFSAVGYYSDRTNKDITSSVTWSSLNTTAATIGAAGMVTSHSSGNTVITAISSTISGSATLTVQAPQLVYARIAPANGYVPSGTSQQFTAAGTFSDGSIQDVTAQVTWGSSNNAIA